MDRNFKYGYLELDINKELFYTTDNSELITEEWKDVLGYEGYYQVSNCGRVKSLERKFCKKSFIMTQSISDRGYLRSKLSKHGGGRTVDTHKMVAISFLGHIPCGYKKIIDHIDYTPFNNTVSNLQEISTRENNSKDQWRFNRSSRYIGVSWAKDIKKWVAKIKTNGVHINLGGFICEEDAGLCYINALKCINEGRSEDIKRNKKSSSSIYKNVSFSNRDKKWSSYFKFKDKRKYIGLFRTEEEAHQALLNYKKQIL